MTFQEHWRKTESIPKELLNIIYENYSNNGLPKSPRSFSNTIIEILKKNADTGGEFFLKDLNILFPKINHLEACTYYNIFVAGSKYASEKISNKF